MYCAGRKLFGWNRRKFISQDERSPWVTRANGAVCEILGNPPEQVKQLAIVYAVCRATLKATNLYNSFGCVDLLQDDCGNWLVLEVGTDGIFNHVDRNIDNPSLEAEINRRIAAAFFLQASRHY